MTHFRHAAFVAAVLALPGFPVAAHSVNAGGLVIADLWSQAVPPGAPTALGYFTIENKGTAPDRLVAVSSPIAERGELHTMTMEGGVMRMRTIPLPAEIAPGQKLVLNPTGNHIMLIGLKQRPVVGENLPLTLTFERAGAVVTYLHVVPIGGSAPADHAEHVSTEVKP